jgi:hypothetical protein
MQRKQPLGSWLPLVLYIIFLHLSWVGAWLVFISLRTSLFPALNNEKLSALWWFIVQFFVWLPPVFAYIYYIEHQNPLSYLRLTTNLGKGIKWGIIFSLLIPLTTLITLGNQPAPIYCNNLPLLFGSSLPAPITEEIVFRGFLLEQFKARMGYLKATIVSSLLFFTIHLVGWFFSDSFPSFDSLLVLLFSLSAFGIFLCYLNRTSNSLVTSIIYHWSNNFYYRRLPCFFKLQ